MRSLWNRLDRPSGTALLLVILVPSLIAPIWLAKQGAAVRQGRDV